MIKACRIVLAAVVCIGHVTCARSNELSTHVLALNLAQARAVIGDKEAKNSIPGQLEKIDALVRATADADLRKPANISAVSVYLLSGGKAAGFSERDVSRDLNSDSQNLIMFSVAHAQGRKDVASRFGAQIDVLRLPPPVGAHAALIRGSLLAPADKAKAKQFFALARLLAPGTLVEEAALRRQLAITDPKLETNEFVRLSERYVQKYKRSPFADHFWEQLKTGVISNALTMPLDDLDRIERLFDERPALRFDLHALLARTALLNGRQDVALREVIKAERSASLPQDLKRIEIYRWALTAETGTVALPPDVSALEKPDLDVDDVYLIKLLRSAIRRVDATSIPSDKETTVIGGENEGLKGQQLASVLSAQDTLSRTEALMKKAPRR